MSNTDKEQRQRLSRPEFFPEENPLFESYRIKIKGKFDFGVALESSYDFEVVNKETGEVETIRGTYKKRRKEVEVEFVKLYASDYLKADLSVTALKVFQKIIGEYEKTKMSGGYVDRIYLKWYNGGLNGHKVGFSKDTYYKGMSELLDKKVIAACQPDIFWVNPHIFFRGDRVKYFDDYEKRRKARIRQQQQQEHQDSIQNFLNSKLKG